jgi:signal transduction histidine kinase
MRIRGEPQRLFLLGLGLTLALTLPVGVFVWVARIAHEQSAREDVQRLLGGMATALAEDVGQCLTEREGDARTLAGDSELLTASDVQLGFLSERLVRNYPAYDLILFADAHDGRIRAASHRTPDGLVLPSISVIGASLAGRSWFARVLQTDSAAPILSLPLAPEPLLRELLGEELLCSARVAVFHDRLGQAQRLCVLCTSAERTVHRLIDSTLERLHLMNVPKCTLVLDGPLGTVIDRDGHDPRLRPTSAAEVHQRMAEGGTWLSGRAAWAGHTVLIAVDATEAIERRVGFVRHYGQLLILCAVLASAGMAVLAVRYRLAKQRVYALLADQRAHAEATSQAKGEMLAIMSHELRTPLNGLMGVSDLLAETRLDGEQSELVDTLRQAGRHLRDLIDNALDHERLLASKMPFASEPTDWRHLVHQVERLMQPVAASAGISLRCTVDAAVPAWVLSDRHRLRQVLSNLLGNALRFTPRGGSVRVGVGLVDDGQRLRCTVSDTGPGIPSGRQAAIFEPFIQADADVPGRFGGSGLGLSICRMIISGLGGRIGVDSQSGHGSTFWFEVSATTVTGPPEGRGSTTSLTGAPPLHLTVLVAEDDEICAFTVTHMLSKLGCTNQRVADGAAAVQAAALARYDVILLDLHMPVLDGKAAARAIRAAEEAGRHTPILAMSASDEEISELRATGFDGMVAKPVTLAELRSALRQAQPGRRSIR